MGPELRLRMLVSLSWL